LRTSASNAEQGPKQGWLIHVYVKEEAHIREINYTGLSSVSTSECSTFKERKVGLSSRASTIDAGSKGRVAIKELWPSTAASLPRSSEVVRFRRRGGITSS